MVADTNNHSIKKIDLLNDVVTEFELIESYAGKDVTDYIVGLKDIDSDLKIILQKVKLDQTTVLNVCTDFTFTEPIKLAQEAKHRMKIYLQGMFLKIELKLMNIFYICNRSFH